MRTKKRNATSLDIFHMNGDNVVLSDDLSEFMSKNILSKLTLVEAGEMDGVLVLGSNLEKSKVEDYIGSNLDDHTCKVLAKAMTNEAFIGEIEEQTEQYASTKGYVVKMKSIDVEYANESFVATIVCSR